MSKQISSRRFTYHERRVLGSIVYQSGKPGFTLDHIDAAYLDNLVKHGLVNVMEVSISKTGLTTKVCSATDLGRETWFSWLTPSIPNPLDNLKEKK